VNKNVPLVSVICLCYNHGKFVRQAIESVLNQSYPNIELVVVDDGSTDNSKQIIGELVAQHPEITFINLSDNDGNCKAFNRAYAISKGDFYIDLAADDVLHSDRIAKGVIALQANGNNFAVNFTDAEWITEKGEHIYMHSHRFPHHTIPEGDVYINVITKYFICPPTMMFRREVIAELGGYDENLSYEDFDFWIRSSRKFLYCYTPEVLVKKRMTKNSLSSKQLKINNTHLHSTYLVCEKILSLNCTSEENSALRRRIIYEISICLRLLDFSTAIKYVRLWMRIKQKV
jgi:glycosyltransferase involved in cell wall biosynthesis